MTVEAGLKDFERRLDALGADLDRWPASAAAEARALMARSPEARAQHDAAARLARLLAAAAQAEAPNGLAFRIVGEVAARRTQRFAWLASPGRLSLAGASLGAAALACGLMLGVVSGANSSQSAFAGGLGFGGPFEVSLATGDL
ncbi:hypothetical protein [Hansschlegelia beijingensis]|uniref:Uncharacterized protein n=1 Tax=Hansschlegelia beijingensis TaxID=1133344 RepID=A0A7W6GFF2_9HYPH|nr:hypothetical protein [Hansschlegelia beijingensis]MBB3973801.1 hypothetical protein [Hansschlegelia beijingensis]